MKAAALRTSVALSALFIAVYAATNWITSQRAEVGTFYFAWERAIPFLPAFIIPYLSIDLFFVAAPFLCADRRELRVFAQRIVFAILCAGVCFLLLPLKLAVPRPQAEGWLGFVFAAFTAADLPYNLFPSLHIALGVLLIEKYARHLRGIWRVVILAWFAAVAASTLFTWQHHVIDLVGGLMLGVLGLYAFREHPTDAPVTRNPRIGAYYAAGAIVLLVVALATRWVGIALLWPALACGLVAAGYFGLGAAIYRKERGQLPLATKLVLAPSLAGQWLSLRHYRGHARAWDVVAPGLWLGRVLDDAEAATAVRGGVTAVLDLTAEFSEAAPFRTIAYRNLPILDLTAPTPAQLDEAVAFLREQAASGIAYVHCKIGFSRSAAIVGAWLIATGLAADADSALARLREARPGIVVRPEAEAALRAFAERQPLTAPGHPPAASPTAAPPAGP